MEKIISVYNEIYNDLNVSDIAFESFMEELKVIKKDFFSESKDINHEWYKDAVVYSMYVDFFNKDMAGLIGKLDELAELGVTCLWLLPILESPMKDAGFDISDYSKVREELLGGTTFEHLIDEAHKRGIKLIFDIAMNHCSEEHEWFKEARQSKDSKYRDYFIWADDDKGYSDARIIFKGLCASNWELDSVSGQYFYHRFFEIQPDLNYRNPEVLLTMTKTLVEWKIKGVDGFRADAVPFIWKEEGTNCENLPKTHSVVKFMRSVMDYLEEGTLILAEACQPPQDVVEYFGNEDECQAAYHFPVMPRIYCSLAQEDKRAIENSLSEDFTPSIPDSCQWFMFLRCHDELTLEMVTPEERKLIYDYYVKDPLWDFREGEGISSRVSELFGFDPKRIKLAYSIMFTLLGTPIIYYGDEYGKGNDVAYYEEFSALTGYKDSRYLVRGPINWEQVDEDMKDENSIPYQINRNIKRMTSVRKDHPSFSRGELTFLDMKDKAGMTNTKVLSYVRQSGNDKILVLQNLSDEELTVFNPMMEEVMVNVLEENCTIILEENALVMEAYDVLWLKLK